jgi:phosphoribosylformylglycinamidine synthase
VVGRVTDTGRMVLKWQNEVVADVPVAPVAGASPVLDRPYVKTPPPVPLPHADPQKLGAADQLLLQIMGSPDIASKRWIFEQYDHMVMADTVMLPGAGDSAVVRVHGSRRGLALTTDCTPRYCASDPYQGGMQAVAEAWRNLTAVGAKPLAITNCLNFGNPERPRIMGQLVGCIEGMAAACKALDFPVVSGNVSLYNETDGRAILPTPNVGGVGLLADIDRLVGLRFADAGLALILVGEGQGWLAGSLLWQQVLGRDDGAPPPVRLAEERRNGDLVRGLIEAELVEACNDLADGGLAVAVAEMCLASGIGAEVTVPQEAPAAIAWLFGEDQARYLLAVAQANERATLQDLRNGGAVARTIGRTGGDALTLGSAPAISLMALRAQSEGWLPGYMGDS